ncbi:type III secretion system inner membrane ring lipoprotein SctJ [Paraburkholderia sp. BR10882]|uniref:type III secretion system inner membrane ring lipoprotein SctJ n=1 Tax=unclassified Paraburkholderia TaxID=2615204 RepID=UPI0034CD7AF7
MSYPVAVKVLPILLILSGCYQPKLLAGLSEQQANEIVAVLQAHNLSADKQDQGKTKFAVAVRQADFPVAVELLQKFDLPTPPRVEVAHAFPADTFVGSPMAEQSRLLSAVEQRLEQNLTAMNNVARARVQISYPLKSSDEDGKGERPMHVAVLLTYRNAVNRDLLVSEVKRFIKNSFLNIEYDSISVILCEAPSISGMMISQPATGRDDSWLYALPGIPAVIGAVSGGLILLLRRRRQASHASEPDSDVPAPQVSDMESTPANKASAPL